MLKVLISFGTRPEAIKMAPLIKVLSSDSRFIVKVLITAQHREMLDQVLDAFKIKIDFDLDLMKKNQSLGELSSRILLKMDSVFNSFTPDIVLVHGDTLSATIVALSAFYHQIDVGHVEAGLRTYDLTSPWPEEGNRQLISRIAKYHFVPTKTAEQCLLNEGIDGKNIFVTGNTVIDSLLKVVNQSLPLPKDYNNDEINIGKRKVLLITGHRRENMGEKFLNICSAIKKLALSHRDVDFIYPVHMNPNIQSTVKKILNDIDNVYLIPPQSYLEFINLMKNSYLILTDSGGIQEEAPSLNVPVLVMRDTTERKEALETGAVKLIGTSQESIECWVNELLRDDIQYRQMSLAENPFGDGNASERIKLKLAESYLL